MTCPQTEATLAWLYGEGDEAHLAHVGGCAGCQALVAEHEEVLHAVTGVDRGPWIVDREAARPGPVVRETVPANRPLWVFLGPAVALAAAAVLLLRLLAPSGPAPAPGAEVAVLPAPPVPVASIDLAFDLDRGLDDLDAELDDLFVDLEAL
ncbi:MAG: hypothetical protein H6737_17845 [Alphaproteobacteria bacterium]|nr:hypothetical protein [Alphaproteobacteria bacterium]